MKKLSHRKGVRGRTKIWPQIVWFQTLGDAVSRQYCTCECLYIVQHKDTPVAQEIYILSYPSLVDF